jgi:ligand-binding sensor domain-containing protein/signal transduction histidine kinase
MKQLTWILFFGLVLFQFTIAQQLYFNTYSIAEGLSQSVVNCIYQDSKGYIWLGTQNGLDRFDGRNFKLFRFNPEDSTSISNNWIYAISEDLQGNLWIGTKGGLHRYIPTQDRFERVQYQTPFQFDVTNYSYDNICLKNGNILINTPPVVSIYNPGEQSFAHFTNRFPYNAMVQDVRIPTLEASDGNIWIGSTNGLALFNQKNGEFSYCTFKNSEGVVNSEENITALFEDNAGKIWVGTTGGLFVAEKSGLECIEAQFPLETGDNFILQACVRSMVQDKKGNLIIGTEGNGVYFVSASKTNKYQINNHTQANSGLGHNIVQPLLIDKSDNLWVGTLSGLSKTDLKEKKFRLFQNSNLPGSTNLLGNVVAGLYKNDNGIIWVGNWGQGLNLLNPESGEVEHFSTQQNGNHFLPNDFVHVIFKDAAKNMWIGTRDGIFIYDKPKNQFVLWTDFFNRPDFPDFLDTRIYHIIQDKNGNIWVASSSGMYKFHMDKPEMEFFHVDAEFERRLGANLVYSLLEDSEGLIWAATINGLECYNPETRQIKHYTQGIDGLSSNFLISLAEDAKGRIWIGSNAYISIFDKTSESFSYMGEESGLPSNYIYEIRKDKNNHMWLATGNGLCSFDIQNNKLEIYTQEDGLQSPEFNLRASFVCPDGEMLFGGMNGFNTFYPDSITGNPHIPSLVFTSLVKTENDVRMELPVEDGSVVKLNRNVQSFSIEFAALEFTNPENNSYAYKMKGISDQWIRIGNRTFVPFFALPPGEYTFFLKGANNDGVWNPDSIRLKLVVMPPWWRSKLAYVAYLLVAFGLLVIFIQLRDRKLLRNKRLLEQKVVERTTKIEEQNQIITSKNNELSELNRTKDKLFSIIGHDLGNHFNIIVGFAEVLLSGLKKMDCEKQEVHIRNIYQSSKHANDLLGNLLTWARLQRNAIVYHPQEFGAVTEVRKLLVFHEEEALKKNILMEVFAREEIRVKADKNMFATIIRNLVANAIKFTAIDGEISINLKATGSFCEITVCDTGVGIPGEQINKIFSIEGNVSTRGTEGEKGTGLGLILCKEFVEKHHGELRVESKVGEGSKFVFTLPLIE